MERKTKRGKQSAKSLKKQANHTATASRTVTVTPYPEEIADYGKSTLFRFSLIHEPEIKSTTATVINRGTLTRSAKRKNSKGQTHAAFKASMTEPAKILETISDLIDLNGSLFDFSEWLAKNNSDFDYETLRAKADGVTVLNPEGEDAVWDTLYRKVTKTEQFSIAPKLISLLRANSVIKEFAPIVENSPDATDFSSDDEKQKLLKLSKALVSIPDEFIPSAEPVKLPAPELFTSDEQSALKKKQIASIASYQNATFSSLLKKFNSAKQEYENEKSTAYNAAINEYNRKYPHPTITSFSRTVVDKETEIPPFKFDFPIFDIKYLEKKECYRDVAETINNLNNASDFCGNFDKIEAYCNKHITQTSQVYNANLPVDPDKKIEFNGHQIVAGKTPKHNSFVIQSIKLLPFHDSDSLVLTHFSNNGSAKISWVNGLLTMSDGSEIEINDCKKLLETYEYVSFVLTENTITRGGAQAKHAKAKKSVASSNTKYTLSFDGSINYENGLEPTEMSLTINAKDYTYGPQPVSNSPKNMVVRKAANNDGEPGNDLHHVYGIKKLGIKDYLRVEQEVCCYVAGEVSHIENVMAREFRKKLVRDLTREEITTEESQETENEQTKDTSTTDRYEMHKEIAQMLAKEQSQQIGITAGMNASYNPGTYSIGVNAGTNLNFSNSSSSTSNFNTAESIAKEVTQKATERILKKVSYKRTAKMLREHEETNEHGFDNRLGSKHVTGIYRWINKIYKNTIYNYGKRLQYDFMVPEPAKNFKWLLSNKQQVDESKRPQAPRKPWEIFNDNPNSFNWDTISETKYAKIAAEYNADVEPCPEQQINIGKCFSDNPTGNIQKWDERMGSFKYEIEIPDGYHCTDFYGNYSHVYSYEHNKRSEANVQIDTSDFYFSRSPTWHVCHNNDGDGVTWFHNPNIYCSVYKTLPVGVTTFNVGGFSLNVVAICKFTDEAYKQWQQKTYRAIMEAYNKKQQAYKDAMLAYVEPVVPPVDYNTNPGIARAIEGRELKRLCIEMMTLQFGLGWSYAKENYLNLSYSGGPGFIPLPLPEFQKHADMVNFFEQAFEWDLISYMFFPYMYADRGQWETLIKTKAPSDPLFEAFLQSGMARVSLCVRPGYEHQVLFFLDTGIIPSGDITPDGKKDVYSSIVDLLVVDEKKPVGDSWETTVPTDLIILQSDAQPLQQHGLPCSKDCKDDNNGLAIGSSELAGMNTETADLINLLEAALEKLTVKVGGVVKDILDSTTPPGS